jgi:molybdate transport system permease protein
LDAPLRERLRKEMLALQDELPLTTIIVTHDPMEAALLADEILVLAAGQVLQSGPTGDLFRRPANETVARVLGAETTGEGFVVGKDKIAIGGGATLDFAGPPLRTGERVGWSFSPACARTSAAGAYQGTVERVATVGIERRIVVRFGGTRIWILDGEGRPLRGERCRFDVGPESVRSGPSDRPVVSGSSNYGDAQSLRFFLAVPRVALGS